MDNEEVNDLNECDIIKQLSSLCEEEALKKSKYQHAGQSAGSTISEESLAGSDT